MATNIVVPTVGESVLEARVLHWRKHEGESVGVGEVLVELETEKVNFEVAAEVAGRLTHIAQPDGADVRPGDVLGVVDETAVVEPDAAAAAQEPRGEISTPGAAAPAPGPAAAAGASDSAHVRHEDVRGPIAAPIPPDQPSTARPSAATPLARRVAAEHDVDISAVAGTGTGGRVTRHDVEGALHQPPPSAVPALAPARSEEHVRLSLRRLTIAHRLVEALRNAAMLTTFNEVDLGAVADLRRRQNPLVQARHGFRLGIAAFFVRAAVAALREFPYLNAEMRGDEAVLKRYFDIGIAVAAKDGLVVPVLRDADRRTLVEIERGIRDFAQRAEQGTLSLEDLRGGTFTITNGGVFGSLLSTPILNPPQVGILGLHRITDRPIARGGQVIIRPMMYVALTYDHRIVDGREAVQFLGRVKALIEDPESLLLEG